MRIKIDVYVPDTWCARYGGYDKCEFINRDMTFCSAFDRHLLHDFETNNVKPCPACLKARDEAKKDSGR